MIASFITTVAAAGPFLLSSMTAQGPPPAQVRVDPVRSESVQERRVVTGEVRTRRRSLVAASEAGLVLELSADAGAVVRAGEVLARLDGSRLELSLSTLRAQRASADVEVEQRREEAAQAQRNLETTRELVEKKTVGEKRLVDATSARNVARIVLAQAESQLQVLAAQQAELEQRIQDTQIRAPFNGVVINKQTEVGEWLDVGEALVEMVSVSELEVWLDVPQRYAPTLANGSAPDGTIGVRIDALDLRLELKGGRAVPQVDPSARTFKLIVPLPPDSAGPGMISAGMSVTASVPSGGRAQHWTVARDALLRGEAGSYLYLAQGAAEDSTAQASRVAVEELFDVDGRVVVRSAGLKANDLAIVEGNERLFPGAPVIAVLADPAGQRAESE